MSDISAWQRFLFLIYKPSSGSLGPLTITPAGVVVAALAGWLATMLLYMACNSILASKLETAIKDEGVVRPVGLDTAGDDHCVDLVGGGRDRILARFACQLALKASPSNFDSASLEQYPHRVELVAHLATSLGAGERFTLGNLRRFVLELQDVKASMENGGASLEFGTVIRSRHATLPESAKEAAFDAAARTLITGNDPSARGWMQTITGMADYQPGALSVEEVLFSPPESSFKGALKNVRIDAITLTEGLVDQLRDASFKYWRLAQAINGGIQWLTFFVAFTAIALLILRTGFARLSAEVCERFSATGQIPANLLEGVRREGWVKSGDHPMAIPKRDRRFLPGRLLSDTTEMAGPITPVAPELIAEAVDGYADETSEHDYALIRWLVDAVPTLGFLGTVYGMILAMGGAGNVVGAESQQALKLAMGELSRNLGTAFDTTAVALLLSLLVGLFLGRAKRAEADLFAIVRAKSDSFMRQLRAMRNA